MEKKGYLLAEVWMARNVIVGPFRKRADGRLEIEEGAARKSGDRRIYAASDEEVALREKDAAVDRRWTEIEEALLKIQPDAILRGRHATYYDFTEAPELLERWVRMLDAVKGRATRMAGRSPSVSFRRGAQVSQKYLAAAALRDPRGFAEARRRGVGTLSLLARYPDLEEQFFRELREPETPPSRPPPMRAPGDPKPLERHGEMALEEMPWKNPLPERGLSGGELAGYWDWALDTRAARLAQAKDLPREEQTEGHLRWLKERWTQVRMLEAILALLHRIVAPHAAYLCGAACMHLEAGMSPEQAKRFLDTLDAFRAITDYESEENYTAEYARGEFFRRLTGARIR